MAAPAYRTDTMVPVGSVGTLTFNKPTGLADGDTILAFILDESGSGAPSPPAGWTTLATDSATALKAGLFSKKVTNAASEPSTYGFTIGSPFDALGCIITYINADVDTGAVSHHPATSTTSITCDSITTTGPDRTVVDFFGSLANATTITTPSGVTSRDFSNTASRPTMRVGDFVQTTAGATPSKTATAGSAYYTAGYSVALKSGNTTTSITVSATCTTSSSLRRQVNRTVSASSSLVASARRAVAHTVKATVGSSATVTRLRAVGISVLASVHTSASVQRVVQIRRTATVATSVVLDVIQRSFALLATATRSASNLAARIRRRNNLETSTRNASHDGES